MPLLLFFIYIKQTLQYFSVYFVYTYGTSFLVQNVCTALHYKVFINSIPDETITGTFDHSPCTVNELISINAWFESYK